jgi:hypothetical protein
MIAHLNGPQNAETIPGRICCALLLTCMILLSACEEKEVAREHIRPVWAMKTGDVSAILEHSFPGRAKAENEVWTRTVKVESYLLT